MTPKRLPSRPQDKAWAAQRRRIAQKYAEVAHLVETEDGAAVNVCVGLCVLAGIAAGDAISVATVGERYSGQDHAAAADHLSQTDHVAGAHRRTLVGLKPAAHYGTTLLTPRDRTAALRALDAIVTRAAALT